MRFILISGDKAPDDALAELAAVIVVAGAQAVLKKHTDSFAGMLSSDIPVGESFGACEALRLFNNGFGAACLLLDYVSKNFRDRFRIFPRWPIALRPGCKSIHRPVHPFIFPRSTGVKGADDEVLSTSHTGFRKHERVKQLVRHYIRFQSWGNTRGETL